MLRPIGFHSALQNVKIPFDDNFFHPLRQGFSHLWILRLPQTGFKKRQGRLWAPRLRSHASGKPWKIGWATRQTCCLHDVLCSLRRITEQKIMVVPKKKGNVPFIGIRA